MEKNKLQLGGIAEHNKLHPKERDILLSLKRYITDITLCRTCSSCSSGPIVGNHSAKLKKDKSDKQLSNNAIHTDKQGCAVLSEMKSEQNAP